MRKFLACLMTLALTSCGYQPRTPVTTDGTHPLNHYNLIYRGNQPGWGWDVVQEWMVEKGFKVVRDSEAKALTMTETMRMVVPTFTLVSSTLGSSTVRVCLKDAISMEPIIETEGTYGMGWSYEGDQRGAFSAAMRKITSQYVAFNPKPREVRTLEKTDLTRSSFESLLKTKGADVYEGIYMMDREMYVIGVIKRERTPIKTASKSYVGIILETKNPLYSIGELKLSFSPSAKGSDLFMDFYDVYKRDSAVTMKTDGDAIRGELDLAGKKSPVTLIKMDIGVHARRGGAVSGGASMGSCFQVNNQGVVITNFHVVDGSKRIDITINGVPTPATIIGYDTRNDLAALRVDGLVGNGRVMPMGKASDISVGKRVFTMGFPAPDSLGKAVKYSEGTISSTQGIQDATGLFQLDAPVHPGNSGGPVLTADGILVGVIVSRINDTYFFEKTGSIAQNINYAIKVGYLKAFLDSQNIVVPEADHLGAGEREAVIKATADFCYLVTSHFD